MSDNTRKKIRRGSKPSEKPEKRSGISTPGPREKKAHHDASAPGARQLWKPGNMLYPLPAVMVSCAGKALQQSPGDPSQQDPSKQAGDPVQRPNILTVAWAGTICSDPAMVSISIRPERYSYELIRESGAFVINLTTKQLVKAMDFCGVRSGRDVDKFREMHLTALPGNKVAAPLIAESPVNIECSVQQIIELGSHHMFLARVEAVDIDERLMDANGKFHLEKAGLIAYSHGTYYTLGQALGTFGYSVRRA